MRVFFCGGVGESMSEEMDLCKAYGVSLEEGRAILTDKRMAKALLPVRRRNSHKGSYGRAAIVAGSEQYTGAAYLSAAACLRSGAGYTVLFAPKGILSLYALKSPEILLKHTNRGSGYAFNEKMMGALLDYDSIAYGMGMGATKETFKGLAYLLKRYTGKLVIDADGLNSLACFAGEELEGLFLQKKCDVIITPHSKELSRLNGKTVEEILKDCVQSAKDFAKKYKVNVLLKNALSVITDGERVALNATGNSGQAKGGSGDVLSGVIAGLCAGGLTAFEGGVLGAYLVGKAAELGTVDFGEYSLTASELIAYLPKAFLFVAEDTDENGDKQ